MKTVEITEASLAEYGRKTAKETWVLTRRGKPVAAVVPIRRGLDFETFSLSHSPDFIDLNQPFVGWVQGRRWHLPRGAEAQVRPQADVPA